MTKSLFIHVPKTGGTSIANTIRGPLFSEQASLNKDKRPCFVEGNATSIIRFSHCRPTMLVEWEVFDRQKLNDWFVFSVIRNPWDRLVSGYHAGIQHPRAGNRALHEANGLTTFDKFARWMLDGNAPYPKRSVMKQGQWVYPQVLWYFVDGKCVIDEILRTESLASDWKKIRSRLGVRSEVHNANSSRHADYRSYYSKSLAVEVGDFYADDCKFGNYTF